MSSSEVRGADKIEDLDPTEVKDRGRADRVVSAVEGRQSQCTGFDAI